MAILELNHFFFPLIFNSFLLLIMLHLDNNATRWIFVRTEWMHVDLVTDTYTHIHKTSLTPTQKKKIESPALVVFVSNVSAMVCCVFVQPIAISSNQDKYCGVQWSRLFIWLPACFFYYFVCTHKYRKKSPFTEVITKYLFSIFLLVFPSRYG